MKTHLVFGGLLGLTAAAVLAYPQAQRALAGPVPPATITRAAPPTAPPAIQAARIEAVFVLDTTGSMSGMIDAAKEKIWSIASSMAQADPAPELRIGLVAYRDRGDAYVTRVVDLSADLDRVYATLMDLAADGGGDGPESVNQALHDAVHRISWSTAPGTYRTVFVVGDAPPHMDYENDVPFATSVRQAAGAGIVVNTIQCGSQTDTARAWQQIASLGQGRYFQVDQAGGAVALATPFDARLAALSRALDDTRLAYGDAATRARQALKAQATDKLHAAASVTARARRAVFNASPSGAANQAGEADLVADVAAGRVDVQAVPEAQLPPALRDLPASARAEAVAKAGERRAALKQEINALAAQRAAHLERELAARGGAAASLDAQVYLTVKEQAGKVGLSYAPATPAY